MTRVAAAFVAVAAALVCVAGIFGHGTMLRGHQTDARAGFVPWALALFLLTLSFTVAALARHGVGSRSRPGALAGVALAATLGALAAVFVGVGVTGRFGPAMLRGDNAVTSLFTLGISLLLFAALPASLLAFGIAVARDSRVPRLLRPVPLLVLVTSAAATAVFAVLPESDETAVAVVWALAVAVGFAALAQGVT